MEPDDLVRAITRAHRFAELAFPVSVVLMHICQRLLPGEPGAWAGALTLALARVAVAEHLAADAVVTTLREAMENMPAINAVEADRHRGGK